MKDFTISYENATVIHSNKYNQNTGFIIWHFFYSNFFQDVVFKLEHNNQEFPTTLNNLNLPLYPGQKVTLVAINDYVVAYIDKKTNEFYYLTTNLQRDLNYGIKINWRIIILITLGFYILFSTFFRDIWLYSIKLW